MVLVTSDHNIEVGWLLAMRAMQRLRLRPQAWHIPRHWHWYRHVDFWCLIDWTDWHIACSFSQSIGWPHTHTHSHTLTHSHYLQLATYSPFYYQVQHCLYYLITAWDFVGPVALSPHGIPMAPWPHIHSSEIATSHTHIQTKSQYIGCNV